MATATAAKPGKPGNGAKGIQTAARTPPKAPATTPAARNAAEDEDLIFNLSDTPDYGAGSPEKSGVYKVKVTSAAKDVAKSSGNPVYKLQTTVIEPDEIGTTIYATQSLGERSMGFVKALVRSFGAQDQHMKRLNLAQFVKPGAVGYVKFKLGEMETVTDEESGEEITRRAFPELRWITKDRYEAALSASAVATGDETPAEEAPAGGEETTDDI